MVKANFSFGGKLALVLVTVVVYTFVLIAGAIGGGLYAYNNVKVGDLLNLVQQSQWISEEYAQKNDTAIYRRSAKRPFCRGTDPADGYRHLPQDGRNAGRSY